MPGLETSLNNLFGVVWNVDLIALKPTWLFLLLYRQNDWASLAYFSGCASATLNETDIYFSWEVRPPNL